MHLLVGRPSHAHVFITSFNIWNTPVGCLSQPAHVDNTSLEDSSVRVCLVTTYMHAGLMEISLGSSLPDDSSLILCLPDGNFDRWTSMETLYDLGVWAFLRVAKHTDYILYVPHACSSENLALALANMCILSPMTWIMTLTKCALVLMCSLLIGCAEALTPSEFEAVVKRVIALGQVPKDAYQLYTHCCSVHANMMAKRGACSWKPRCWIQPCSRASVL